MISLNKRKDGFTIVELLIVIVVIGILAGLVITTYNGIQQKARNTERTTDLKTFQSQLEAYYANNGRYPSNANLGTNSATNLTFIAQAGTAGLKGMEKETIRDPKGADADYSLLTAAIADSSTPNKYSYVASPASCDNTTTDCTSYTLSEMPEGATKAYVLTSLN